MKKILKDSFQILKNNTLFLHPIVLYILFALIAISYLSSANTYVISKITISLSLILMTIAFVSGWVYINKKAIEVYNENDNKITVADKSIANFKLFFEGVGKNFFKVLFSLILILVLNFAFFELIYNISLKAFGESNLLLNLQKYSQITSQNEIIDLVKNTADIDKIIFIEWILTMSIASFIASFFNWLYLAVIFSEEKNPILCLWKSIKFFCKNIINCSIILLFTFGLWIILSFITAIIGNGSFALFIFIVLISFYLNYNAILILRFYNEKK